MAGEICLHQHHCLPIHIHPFASLLYDSSCMSPHRKVHHSHCKYYAIGNEIVNGIYKSFSENTIHHHHLNRKHNSDNYQRCTYFHHWIVVRWR